MIPPPTHPLHTHRQHTQCTCTTHAHMRTCCLVSAVPAALPRATWWSLLVGTSIYKQTVQLVQSYLGPARVSGFPWLPHTLSTNTLYCSRCFHSILPLQCLNGDVMLGNVVRWCDDIELLLLPWLHLCPTACRYCV